MFHSWFVVGQLLAPVALRQLNMNTSLSWRVAIYTEWAMIGLIIIIFVFLPESPCESTSTLSYRLLITAYLFV